MSSEFLKYDYKILKHNGDIIKNTFQGNEDEFKKCIKGEDGYLIDYKIKKQRNRSKKILTDKSMYIICKNLYVQIKSGLNIKYAFKNLSEMNLNKDIKNIFENLYKSVLTGTSIKESMVNLSLPREFIVMMGAGETSGTMEDVLKKLTEFYMHRWKTKKTIINRITYPLLLLIIFNIMILIIFSKILPKFNNISEYKISNNVRWIFEISNFINQHMVLTIIINIALYYVCYKFIRNITLNRIPILKKYVEKYYYLSFFSTFEILHDTGIKYDEILLICSEAVGNKELEEAAKEIRLNILRGHGLTESFIYSNKFPQIINNILNNGENCGDLTSSLELINEIYKEEFLDTLDRLIKFIEPFIILTIAFIVGMFLVKIMVPIMNSFYEI
ncbi:type II secretion system F family protein [Clostridium frigidicarnis]|uniref:Type II secretion system protein F (GspF) n=1 Tax=Clostridium frigidicarnis TaxID=84698 RepID=A0A1I0WIR8_9CLOT|nr:type II secretion system F family protein [Clostridium frigidicarnis]SFA88020.1 type II secretion system protein F (GspF) [Clostridium frigidicarnis]